MTLRYAYWVSTPRCTCLVEVCADGTIGRTAPLLWRQWHGRPWVDLQAALQARWGAQAQVEPMTALGPPPRDETISTEETTP